MIKLRTLVVAAALAATFNSARAEINDYYDGVDNRPIWTTGTYASQPNPNRGRLTFLYAHAFAQTPFNNHYHTIGSYFFVGPSNAPVVVPTNANFRIPEGYTGQPPLTLTPATNGPFVGKLVNRATSEHYSDARISSVHRLLQHVTSTRTNTFGWGSGEYIMFHSSGGRFTNSLDGVVVAMELVQKSPELRVGTATQPEALANPGDRVTMGDGANFEFTPVVWAEPNTAPGTYELKFKLVDVGGGPSPALESGIVTFWYRVVGEPQLTIAKTVMLKMPQVTDGYVLEEAPSVDGPWTPLSTAPTLEVVGSGEGAAQTGLKFLSQSAEAATKVYRLRKL
ncbi:MAG: hypothetical protein FJ405_00480 [Verrucomicrobia bacterium]|nr:hypothetical protein [Verrucomicrobiota bacterium]